MNECSSQRVEEVERRKKKPSSPSRMVCPAVGEEERSSHWIRNTCFGGFVTVVSGGEHGRARAVARLEGISKYDREGKVLSAEAF